MERTALKLRAFKAFTPQPPPPPPPYEVVVQMDLTTATVLRALLGRMTSPSDAESAGRRMVALHNALGGQGVPSNDTGGAIMVTLNPVNGSISLNFRWE